jgi:hypothetical protein
MVFFVWKHGVIGLLIRTRARKRALNSTTLFYAPSFSPLLAKKTNPHTKLYLGLE